MNLQTAIDHHLNGRWSEAETGYQQLLAESPDQPDILCLYGMLAQQLGHADFAIASMSRAIAIQPHNALYHYSLGNVYKETGRKEEAVLAYRQTLQLQANHLEALFNLASVFQQQRQFEDAIPLYRQILMLKPDYAEAHNDLGVALMARCKLAEAILSFQQAVACNPAYAEAHNNLGVAYKNQGKYDEAAACYRQALDCNPAYAKALFNLGTIFFIKKDMAEAMKWYKATLEIDPGQIEAHQNLASIYLDAGYLQEAKQHRDCAYQQQSVFIDTALNPARCVLVLWAAGKGNVPIDYLLPMASNTRIVWMVEYPQKPQEMPDYDLVFNAIGDQDVTAPTAGPVQEFLSHCTKPVLNLPDAIARTTRDQIPGLFAGIENLHVPVTVAIETTALKQVLQQAPHLRFPMIVRPSSSHGGDHLVKLESASELAALQPFNSPLYYASNYCDYQSSDGNYRKYRMIFVDRRPYPYHMAIGPHWIVHYETAGMQSEAWKLEEEKRFLENPESVLGEQAMHAIVSIGKTMDLDYCGVDFSILPDGSVLVFEANATMLVHPEDANGVLQHKNAYVQRIFDAFNQHMDGVSGRAGKR